MCKTSSSKMKSKEIIPPQGLTKTQRNQGQYKNQTPSTWPQYFLVASISAACYINGLSGEFVHDDVPAVVLNKDVVSGRRILRTFGDDFWGTPMTDSRSHKSYRPLTTLTFRANYVINGLDPLWFHGTNVLLHVLATILFMKVCIRVARMSGPFATLAGLMFAVHPIHTEAVTGIVGRADVLACVFFLGSILAYHDSTKCCRIWTSILFAGLSILAKETGITVFIVNLLLDIYRSWNFINLRKSSETRWTKRNFCFIKRTSILLITFSVLIVLRLVLLKGSVPKISRGDNPAAFNPSSQVRFLTFSYIAAFNFWLLLCPAHLSHDWQMGSIPLITSILDSRNLLTLLIFTLILLLFLKTFKKSPNLTNSIQHHSELPNLSPIYQNPQHPEFNPEHFSVLNKLSLISLKSQTIKRPKLNLILALLILLIPFLPGSNLVTTTGFVLAERVLYIPSMGFILLVVQGLKNIWNVSGRHRQTLISLMAFLLIVHGLQCVTRNKDWQTRESLLRAGVITLPHNAKMHYNFANFLRDSGKVEVAIAHYHTAIRLWPTYASAHNNLGTLIKNGDEAENHFLLAIRFNQGHLNAHYNLGQLYRKQNRTIEAETMLKKCIDISPNFTLSYVELIKLQEQKTKNASDIGFLLKTIVRQSKEAEYSLMYAEHLNKTGNYILALKYFTSALSVSNNKLEALTASAAILRRLGSQSRLFQLITRFHLMQRIKRGEIAIQPNVYLQRWFLSYELEKHALDYNPGYWATDGVTAGDIFVADKQDSLLFRYQRDKLCVNGVSAASATFENVTIETQSNNVNNCKE